jgi:hypothetical protein
MSSAEPAGKHEKLLHAWQLAILRLAVTLDSSDDLFRGLPQRKAHA